VLLFQAAAVVHHGGAGTTARALWSAVPSVIFPVLLFYDQPGWASLLEEQALGVRCASVERGGGSVAGLRASLERALALPRDGSAAMGAAVRAERGVHRAAALLEGVGEGYRQAKAAAAAAGQPVQLLDGAAAWCGRRLRVWTPFPPPPKKRRRRKKHTKKHSIICHDSFGFVSYET
jgi:hypothetical protein